jgi:hypothetical protein
MDTILSRLINYWDILSIWITNQPTFVEVAFGVGLFYLVLQILKVSSKGVLYILSGVFRIPRRFRKQKDMRGNLRSKKSGSADDEAPPFVFR